MGYSPFHLEDSLKTRILNRLGLKWFLKPKTTNSLAVKKNTALTPLQILSSFPPELKQKLLAKRYLSYSLWIYKDYLLDLQTKTNNPRKILVKKIFNAAHDQLNWPSKQITFWPLFYPLQGKYVCNLELFEFGLKKIQPTYIFCFGQECFKCLLPQEDFAYNQIFEYKKSLLIALPDFNDLLPDNRELKKIVWEALKRYVPRQI
ncbi:MAG: hypothetical protein PWR24_2036 [Desulfonauticus sp.]|nr:hypothetical protein [Desulfonauticus sp.]